MFKKVRGWFQRKVATWWLETMDLAQYLADESEYEFGVSRADYRVVSRSLRRRYILLGNLCVFLYGANRPEWKRSVSSGSDYEILVWCKKILAGRFFDPEALRLLREHSEWEERELEKAQARLKAQNPPAFPSAWVRLQTLEHHEAFAVATDSAEYAQTEQRKNDVDTTEKNQKWRQTGSDRNAA